MYIHIPETMNQLRFIHMDFLLHTQISIDSYLHICVFINLCKYTTNVNYSSDEL